MQALIAGVIGIILLGGGYYIFMMQDNEAPEAPPAANMEMQLPIATLPVDPGTTTTSGSASTTPTNTAGAAATTGATTGATKEFTVTNSGMLFSESNLTVNKGDKVKITYKNGGGTHDLRIAGYNVGTKVIKGGESETIEFTADTAGDFEFYCSVGNHRAMGMKGTFTVK